MAHDQAHSGGSHGNAAVADIFPAGASYSHDHHGHTIVPQRVLLTVLGVLMFFTLLTVGCAQVEHWVAHTFNCEIPQWVNVTVALSIAVIKSTIVAMYFMQLRYDNPINSLIVIFTLFTLAFFLGFTMIDLGNRDTLYKYKAEQIVPGGSGGLRASNGEDIPVGTSIAAYSRDRAMNTLSQTLKEGKKLPTFLVHFAAEETERFEAANKGKELPAPLLAFERVRHEYAGVLAHDEHGDHPGGDKSINTPNQSRVRKGITLPEFMAKTPAGHGESAGGEKPPEVSKPAESPKH